MSFSQKLVVWIVRCYYCQTQKTANTWKISGMLIVYWPITIKFRIREQTSKPQPDYRCCLRFSCLTPYWLISRNTITFHQYFGVHGFVSFMGSCWRHLWMVHPRDNSASGTEYFNLCSCWTVKNDSEEFFICLFSE